MSRKTQREPGKKTHFHDISVQRRTASKTLHPNIPAQPLFGLRILDYETPIQNILKGGG